MKKFVFGTHSFHSEYTFRIYNKAKLRIIYRKVSENTLSSDDLIKNLLILDKYFLIILGIIKNMWYNI